MSMTDHPYKPPFVEVEVPPRKLETTHLPHPLPPPSSTLVALTTYLSVRAPNAWRIRTSDKVISGIVVSRGCRHTWTVEVDEYALERLGAEVRSAEVDRLFEAVLGGQRCSCMVFDRDAQEEEEQRRAKAPIALETPLEIAVWAAAFVATRARKGYEDRASLEANAAVAALRGVM